MNLLHETVVCVQGRLNELMSQIRMQNHLAASRADSNYQMDSTSLQEIKMVHKLISQCYYNNDL